MQTTRCHKILLKIMLIILLAAMALTTSFSLPAAVVQAAATSYTLLDPVGSSVPVIDAKAYVLYDAGSRTFLVGKAQDEPLAPASVTKVMTVLLALENLELTDTIIVTRDMFETVPNDYTRLGLVEGEEITVEQALYASLLISANDASLALAVAVGGSIENFVTMMNTRAAELGCLSTHFTNPYGLADPEHLTTAHDIALILAEALKHDLYTQLATTRHYQMAGTVLHPEERGMQNGNRFVSNEQFECDGYIGGKTGFTELSSYTITAGVRRDGRTLISVVLGASYSAARYSGCISLFDYGFANFQTITIRPDDFQSIKDQTIALVNDAIGQVGNQMVIDEVVLELDDTLTTTTTRAAKPYSCDIDNRTVTLQADLAIQTLEYPLYYAFNDGTRYPVGRLAINVAAVPTETTTTSPVSGSKGSVWRTVLRVIAIILLIVVVAFCLLMLYAMIRHDLKRKRRNRLKGRK